jgi:hypothetical protein
LHIAPPVTQGQWRQNLYHLLQKLPYVPGIWACSIEEYYMISGNTQTMVSRRLKLALMHKTIGTGVILFSTLTIITLTLSAEDLQVYSQFPRNLAEVWKARREIDAALAALGGWRGNG